MLKRQRDHKIVNDEQTSTLLDSRLRGNDSGWSRIFLCHSRGSGNPDNNCTGANDRWGELSSR